VYGVAYGDDMLLSVRDEVAPWFNQINYAAIMEEIGLKCTNATKGEVDKAFVGLDEASFLKRGFVLRRGQWFGPLETDTLEEMICWTTTTAVDGTKVNAYNACMEAFAHGEAYFHDFRKTISNYAIEKGVEVDLPTLYQARDWWVESLSTISRPKFDLYKISDAIQKS